MKVFGRLFKKLLNLQKIEISERLRHASARFFEKLKNSIQPFGQTPVYQVVSVHNVDKACLIKRTTIQRWKPRKTAWMLRRARFVRISSVFRKIKKFDSNVRTNANRQSSAHTSRGQSVSRSTDNDSKVKTKKNCVDAPSRKIRPHQLGFSKN